MKTPLTLLVMAAGMGSRYGGLKQVEGFGPHGETLLEYSLYDAMNAGFTRAVFIIRRDLETLFREKVMARFAHRLDCTCVFQELTDLPEGVSPPAERQKPWGTGHAVLAARGAVRTPFAVINADDYYGQAAFGAMAAFLSEADVSKANYALCGYRLRQTLSEHGTVSRGLCLLDETGSLISVTEHTKLESDGHGGALSHQPDGEVPLSGDSLVSMNFWGFTPIFFSSLRDRFAAFIAEKGSEPKAEFYLPSAVDHDLRRASTQVKVLPTESSWFGVTYPEDQPRVAQAIAERIARGEYPRELWS